MYIIWEISLENGYFDRSCIHKGTEWYFSESKLVSYHLETIVFYTYISIRPYISIVTTVQLQCKLKAYMYISAIMANSYGNVHVMLHRNVCISLWMH